MFIVRAYFNDVIAYGAATICVSSIAVGKLTQDPGLCGSVEKLFRHDFRRACLVIGRSRHLGH